MNPVVELSRQEWQQVLAVLSTAPWRDVNQLLMKIGQQLQQADAPTAPIINKQAKADGKEADHG
jgi:hypothetical protein